MTISSEVFEHLSDQWIHLSEVATPNPEISAGENEFHTKENTYQELMAMLTEHFSESVIVETILAPPTDKQRKQQQERIASGHVGVNPKSPLAIFGREVDTSDLHNTHSFFCFSIK